ncbi:MAG: hypothetical protein ACJATE_000009 [Bacteroidia bacterium]|jgi:hypothetical protein
MKRHVLSILLAFLFSATAIAQNYSVTPFSNTPARPKTTISKTVGNSNQVNPNTTNEYAADKCLQHSVTEELMERNAEYRQGVESARQTTNQIIRDIDSGERSAPPVYTIPVVFHVIHKGEAVGSVTNISTAQLESAIDALNRDFRRTNDDNGIALGNGPDTEIQFCLAGVDPNGNPHSGINRVNGSGVSGYSASGITPNVNALSVKNLSRWDNRYYLNIWVVSEISNNGADVSNVNSFFGGTIGYAYLPTNPVTFNSDLDGIVILNLSVGNDPNGSQGFRLWGPGETNRSLTHEVGHFLGLNHVFNDNNPNVCSNGDGIGDTPNAQQVNMFNCNYNGSCSGQQIENYMDYTPEQCQDQFTAGQTSVMRGFLTGARNQLVNTSNCGVSTNYDAAITAITAPSGSLCQTSFTPVVTLNNFGATTLTSVEIDYFVDSQTPSTFNWTGNLGSNSAVTVTLPLVTTTTTPPSHTFTARTVSGTLNGSNNDEVTSNDQSTSSFSVGSGGTSVTLTLDLDCYGEETTWEIRDASNQVIISGGPYTNGVAAEQVLESVCLAEGCYDFNIFDSQSDGLSGTPFGCGFDGDYSITDGSSTLVQMTADPNFGASTTHNFCIGGGGNPVTACEDLFGYDGGTTYFINNNDAPNFEFYLEDVDEQIVATALTDAGYNSEWMGFYESENPGDTNFFRRVASWFDNTAAPASNWAMFGPITIPSDGGELTWNHRFGNNLYRDGYEVLVNYNGATVSDFNGAASLFSVSDNAGTTDGDTLWAPQVVDLPAGTYANQSIYLGFHHNALDELYMDFDDIIVEGCSSITVDISEEEQFNLNVFPNPSSNNFTFQYQSESSDNLDFRMLNSLGQEVWNYQSKGSQNGIEVIETQGLSTGVYTLVVKGDRMNVSERLILTK